LKRRQDKRLALFASAALGVVLSASALAQSPAQIDVSRQGQTTRVQISLPEMDGDGLSADAEVAAGAVLVARLSEPIEADVSEITAAAPDYIAMARLDPDGRTLRLALNQTLESRVSVSHNIIAIDIAPPGAAPLADVVSPYELAQIERARQARAQAAADAAAAAAPPPALPVDMRIGEAAEYSRIVFQWPEAVTYSLEQADGRAVLTFSRAAELNLAPLTAAPPRFIDAVTERPADSLSLSFLLASGAEARVWSDEPGRVVFDVSLGAAGGAEAVLAALSEYADQLEAQAPTASESVEPAGGGDEALDTPDFETPNLTRPDAEARPDPVPEDGIVRVEARRNGTDVVLNIPWASLPGAAVFRRGQAIWVVFDASAELDVGEMATLAGRHIRNHEVLRGADYTAMRIEAPNSTQTDVRPVGTSWVLTFSETVDQPPAPIRVTRETGVNRPARLRFNFNGARSVRTVTDPVVGDSILVLTSDGEKYGVISPRQYVEAVMLPSTQGVALQPLADDLIFTVRAGGADLSRPGGLALTRAATPGLSGSLDRPVTPGFLDLAAYRGEGDYRDSMVVLQRRASELDPAAILNLARFKLGWQLAAEALGLIELAVEENPSLDASPEIAALRGVASYMMGRYEDADRYLSHPVLLNDPAAQSWRGAVSAQLGDWPQARRRFEQGREAIYFFDPVWRARLSALHAMAVLKTNDLGAVEPLLNVVAAEDYDLEARTEAAMVQAGLAAASGDVDQAIALYDALSRSDWRPARARALLEKVRLEFANERVAPDEAVETLESLRFRWRGDDVEVEASTMLGEVYADAGRFPEALNTMSSALSRFSNTPEARRLSVRLETLFRDIFLNGQGDRMDPMEALALWYEHQDLTPPGPDGLRMARRIAARLVEVDLLEPASELLAHQVFERRVTMTSLARAQVAADLARVYLIDNRASDALRALDSTRIAGLPNDLVDERRVLQARALAALGRTEHALELVAYDQGPEADRLRADIAWEGRNWSEAGRLMEALLGDRWRSDRALSSAEAHDVLRALIAYALVPDEAGMDRVVARYGRAMGETEHAAAFSTVANRSVAPGDSRLSSLVGQIANVQRTDALMAGFGRYDEVSGPES
jgi:tetratricopeptide (TPR) repeat protein